VIIPTQCYVANCLSVRLSRSVIVWKVEAATYRRYSAINQSNKQTILGGLSSGTTASSTGDIQLMSRM